MAGSERGEVSMTSLIVACALLVSVLAATLNIFDGFIGRASEQTARTDAQDAARSAADKIARNLRNLADPTPVSPQVVERAGPRDLIFKMVDAEGPNAGTNSTNTQRVRYCLDAQRRLRQQTQTWTTTATPALPTDTACPGNGWPATAIAATSIVNEPAIPVFTYDTTALTAVAGIHVDLLVDTEVGRGPVPTRLSTGVFLRNQNRTPTASFEATATGGGIVLNGSGSTDPEGAVLRYVWHLNPGPSSPPIGEGITLTQKGLVAGQTYVVRLTVSDPSGLTNVLERSVVA